VDELLSFLQHQFDNGAGYSTLNSARSAVSLLSTTITSSSIGGNPLVVRFLKGVGKTRPPIKKYNSIWNPEPVLTYLASLEPANELSSTNLTLKLVGLLALATAQRVQTLCAIKISNIQEKEFGYEIFITDPIKTSKAGRDQPSLIIPKFEDHPEWCVYRVINLYLDRTKDIRLSGTDQLLLAINSPFNPVTTQTISRWIKRVLLNSGIDSSVFSAHSTRHVATSTAAKYGVTLDQIRSRAGWSGTSNIFARFYNRPIDDRHHFAKAVFAISSNNVPSID